MPRPRPRHSHPPLTEASRDSHIEIECLPEGVYAYRLNGGPRRYIRPAPYGIYNVLRQLDALIEIESATAQEAAELRRLERELHEDLIEHEFQLVERENARLYTGTTVPPRCCEPRHLRKNQVAYQPS